MEEEFKAIGYQLPDCTRPCRWYDRATRTWHAAPNGHGHIPWWEHLDGMTGPEGAAFLHQIIGELCHNAGRYRVMNPENGWGDYDGILNRLEAMRNAVPEWPTIWKAWG